MFAGLAALCRRFNIASYTSRKAEGKLIFVSHMAFFLLFLGTTVPYSIGMVKVLFAPDAPSALLQPSLYRCLLFPIAFQLAMYVFEVKLLQPT